MNITWYGTASIMIDDGKTKLLFDPFVRQNKKLKDTTPIEGFAGADAVLITHGHFDHLFSVPKLTEIDKDVKVYCTKAPADTLKKNNVDESRIKEFTAGDSFKIGDFTITTYKAKHIIFDPLYILSVTPKFIVSFVAGLRVYFYHKKMPMKKEIVMYDVENGGKHILLTGSFGYFHNIPYPHNPDAFILANGGNVFVPELTKGFIDHINPKKVIVDHFDDAFPPLTRPVDTKRLKHTIEKNHPDIEVIVPKECVPFAI